MPSCPRIPFFTVADTRGYCSRNFCVYPPPILPEASRIPDQKFEILNFQSFENSVVGHFLMIFKHSDISEVVKKKKAKMQLVPMILLTQLLIVWTKSLVSLCCHCRGSFEYYNDNGHFTIFSITVIHRHFTTKNPYTYGPKKNRKKRIVDFYMEKK